MTTNAYDDAEFAAIRVVRLATEEGRRDSGQSTEILRIISDLESRHGQAGIDSLVLAMGRQYAAALGVVAEFRKLAPEDVIEEFERHKLVQIDDEISNDEG